MIPNDPWARFWALGYRAIVPITPPNARLSPHGRLSPKSLGKAPGRLNGEGWTGLTGWTTHETTEADIDEWRDWGAGIGIVCRDGDLGIDADTLDFDLSNVIRTEIETRIGPIPLRVGQAPKALFYCRTAPGYRHPNLSFAGGEIEVRTSGQFVASGTHPVTGKGYEWLRELPPHDALPYVEPATLDALWSSLREKLPGGRFTAATSDEALPQEALRGKLEDVRRAVAAIPNDYAERRVYVRMGYAIKAALPDHPREAYELYFDWCKSWTLGENDDETIYRDWDGYRGEKRVGWGWLKAEADLRTNGRFSAETWFESPVVEPTPPEPLFPDERPEENELRGFPASDLGDEPPPPQRWLARDLIPSGTVTMLYGDGATGKSLAALQLCVARVTGTAWLGHPIERGPAMFLTAEDDHEELNRRLHAILKGTGMFMADLSALDLIPLVGEDAVLAAPNPKTGLLEPTPLYRALQRRIARLRPSLLVLDTLADLFGGDEIKRIQARQFIRLMIALTQGLDFELTVLLLAHPSLAGMANGTGTSGSTGWSNSVRSRLSLERRYATYNAKQVEIDSDIRVLSGKKSNRSRAGAEIVLRWAEGRFTVESAARLDETSASDEAAFLTLLDEFERAGRPVGAVPTSASYAPRLFITHAQGGAIGRARLETAMTRLFGQSVIELVSYGPPAKKHQKIARKTYL